MSRPTAPGSLFSVCSPPDSKTIGVPHPEPGRGRRCEGNGGFCYAFVPLLLRARPLWAQLLVPGQHVPSPHPGPRAAPASTSFGLGWLSGPSSMECKALRPRDLSRPVLGKRPSWGSHLAPAACRSRSGNHLPNGPCLTTCCASGSGQMGPCPCGDTTVVEEEAVNKEARTWIKTFSGSATQFDKTDWDAH